MTNGRGKDPGRRRSSERGKGQRPLGSTGQWERRDRLRSDKPAAFPASSPTSRDAASRATPPKPSAATTVSAHAGASGAPGGSRGDGIGSAQHMWDGVDLYTKLPSALRARGYEPPAEDSRKALDDLLNDLLGSDVGANETAIQSKLRDRALVLDALPQKRRREPIGRGVAGTALRRQRLGGLNAQDVQYSQSLQLHSLWIDYAHEALIAANGAQRGSSAVLNDALQDFDLHGALVEVVRCADPTLVGRSGVVLVETANTVCIVSEDHRLRTVAKKDTVVVLKLGDHLVEMNLGFFAQRPRDRKRKG